MVDAVKSAKVTVLCCEETASTNTLAKEYAKAHPAFCSPVAFVAERQTMGRGRLGRQFVSHEGGIYLSLLLPAYAVNNFVSVTAKACVAVCRAIEKMYGIHLGIKWVNDLQIEGKKVCGILCESAFDSGKTTGVIIGVGMNFGGDGSCLPEDVRNTASYLFPCDNVAMRHTLTGSIIDSLCDVIADYDSYLSYYREHSTVIGKHLRCVRGNDVFCGIATDIDNEFGLKIALDGGGTIVLRSGEITVREK